MSEILIISSSIRKKRNSHRVALFLQQYIAKRGLGEPEILDLREYNFPLFEERLTRAEDPDERWVEASNKINNAKGVIIVTPEYNGGYPASLKNVIDFMYKEWRRKPIALAAVSDGQFGGTQVVQSLQFVLWKIGAWTVPARFHASFADKNYDEQGVPADKKLSEKMAEMFIDELLWCMEAKRRMSED